MKGYSEKESLSGKNRIINIIYERENEVVADKISKFIRNEEFMFAAELQEVFILKDKNKYKPIRFIESNNMIVLKQSTRDTIVSSLRSLYLTNTIECISGPKIGELYGNKFENTSGMGSCMTEERKENYEFYNSGYCDMWIQRNAQGTIVSRSLAYKTYANEDFIYDNKLYLKDQFVFYYIDRVYGFQEDNHINLIKDSLREDIENFGIKIETYEDYNSNFIEKTHIKTDKYIKGYGYTDTYKYLDLYREKIMFRSSCESFNSISLQQPGGYSYPYTTLNNEIVSDELTCYDLLNDKKILLKDSVIVSCKRSKKENCIESYKYKDEYMLKKEIESNKDIFFVKDNKYASYREAYYGFVDIFL